MLWSFAYVVIRNLFALVVLVGRPRCSNDLKILVLRHELTILRRQSARPRLTRADRTFLAALSRSLLRCAWAYTRIHVRGVPAAAFGSDGDMLEVYTGSVTVVIFGSDAARRLRVARALKPVNALAGHPAPDGDLPPPVPGALEGTLTCS